MDEKKNYANFDTAPIEPVFSDLVVIPEKIEKPTEPMKKIDIENQELKDEPEVQNKILKFSRVGMWFQTICWMNIPVFGFIYLLILAFGKKTPKDKKSFAKAYILFQILVMCLALTILFVFYKMGLSFMEQILHYIDIHS